MIEKTLDINDTPYGFTDGETILEVARRNEIFIPTLCFLEGLSRSESCRLCVVEVTGMKNLMPACTTLVREAMQVYTDTESLREYRRTTLEMLFAAGHHVCAACIANGHCELQTIAQQVGVDSIRFPHRTPMVPVDMTHKRFGFDPNRCILCTRCIRACEEVEGAHVWYLVGRGSDSRIAPNMGAPWGNTNDCTACGKCMQSCPTGAIFDKYQSLGHMEKDCGLVGKLVNIREKN